MDEIELKRLQDKNADLERRIAILEQFVFQRQEQRIADLEYCVLVIFSVLRIFISTSQGRKG